jgi:hypothetical protein
MVATHQVRQVSPIPPGRYWLTVLGDNRQDFVQWVHDMAGAVRTTTTEEDLSATPPSLFVIFEVPPGRAPFLNAAQFGFPNDAPPGVHSSQDVEQVPEPEGLKLPDFGDVFSSPATWLVLLLLFGGDAISQAFSGGRRRRAA